MRLRLFLLLSAFLASCGTYENADGSLAVTELSLTTHASLAPNLFIGDDGQVYLSWVEQLEDGVSALLFSELRGNAWSEPREVARGDDWFVNWADFPSLALFGDDAEQMAAHWLQKSAQGTYDYDVRLATTRDGGQSWSSSFIPHTDGVAAEHGFVTLLPLPSGRILATWLDGRNTKKEAGAMTLHTAEFDPEGKLYADAELDPRICDCCQTDAALTANGPIIVYRDRSEGEIRDIGIVRKVDGSWTAPSLVHNDNWEIAGCPVNGPAITAKDDQVAVAWYTGANGEQAVKVAFSEDAGASFGAPIRIDDGKPSGRVDVVFSDAQTALVSWLENTDDGGEVRLARVSPRGKLGNSLTATRIGTSRQSGFPILEKAGDRYILAWTHTDEKPEVKTLTFELD